MVFPCPGESPWTIPRSIASRSETTTIPAEISFDEISFANASVGAFRRGFAADASPIVGRDCVRTDVDNNCRIPLIERRGRQFGIVFQSIGLTPRGYIRFHESVAACSDLAPTQAVGKVIIDEFDRVVTSAKRDVIVQTHEQRRQIRRSGTLLQLTAGFAQRNGLSVDTQLQTGCQFLALLGEICIALGVADLLIAVRIE